LSRCTWYTPDFVIGNRLIVEVDGGIHDRDYRKTPDRIRQRALENMGYSVYRVRNKEVESSPFDVAGMIVDRYYQIMEVKSEGEAKNRERISQPKIKKTYNPSRLEPLLLYLLLIYDVSTKSSKIGTFKLVICCLLRHLLVTY
jgi:hypothetical protein